MGHWAQINTKNYVQRVVVADDDRKEWLETNLGGVWIQTSYNTYGGVHYDQETGQPSLDQSKALRFNYAGIGFTYDEVRDAFIPPQPSESWVLNEETCLWEPPVIMPNDGKRYVWIDELDNWVAVPEPASEA